MRPLTAANLAQDLHDVTPNEFLEMASGIFHALSYQQVPTLPPSQNYRKVTVLQPLRLRCAAIPEGVLCCNP